MKFLITILAVVFGTDALADGRINNAAIASNAAIALPKLAPVAANTILGNNTGVPGSITALTVGQAASLLSVPGDAFDLLYTPTVSGNWLMSPINVGEALDELAGRSVTTGNLTDAGTDGITVTGGTGAVVGSGTSLAQHVSDSTHNGYLSSTDWTTFNGKQASITTGTSSQYFKGDLSLGTFQTDVRAQVSATAPLDFTAGVFSMPASTNSVAGYLTAADHTTFAAKEPAITAGTSSQYLKGDKSLGNVTSAGAVSSVVATDANGNLNLAGDRAIEDPRYGFHIHREFLGYQEYVDPGNNTSSVSCSGTSCKTVDAGGDGSVIDNAHPGIAPIATGTTTTGKSWMTSGNTVVFGGGPVRLEWVNYWPALSDGTDTYSVMIGFSDNFSYATDCSSNGLFVTYTHGTNSGNFVFHACSGGSKSTTNCTFGPNASAWNRYDITTNAAGTSASFQLNDGTACTIATNIPNVQGRNVTWGNIEIDKSAGTNDRRLNVDYVDLYMKFTTPR